MRSRTGSPDPLVNYLKGQTASECLVKKKSGGQISAGRTCSVMAYWKRFLYKLRNFSRPDRAEQDLAREIGSHLELLQDEFRRRGMNPDEARLAAKRTYGGIEQAKELHREA